MSERRTYRATVWYEDETGLWLVAVDELDLLTQARRLPEVERMARSIISLHLDVSRDSFEIEMDVRLPEEVSDELARARELRERADRANQEAAALTRDVARKLAAQGLTVRDVGAVLGVSFQRAAQLLGRRAS